MVYRGEISSSIECGFIFILSCSPGYIDDVRNTDNAWVEAEVWNFHYDLNMLFPHLRNDVCFNIFLPYMNYLEVIFDCRIRLFGKM